MDGNIDATMKKNNPKQKRYLQNIITDLGLLSMIHSKSDGGYLLHIFEKKGKLEYFRLRTKLIETRKKYKLPKRDYPSLKVLKLSGK